MNLLKDRKSSSLMYNLKVLHKEDRVSELHIGLTPGVLSRSTELAKLRISHGVCRYGQLQYVMHMMDRNYICK